MRRTVLILALVACGAVAAYSLVVGWPEKPRGEISLPATSEPATPPESSAELVWELPAIAEPIAPPRAAAVPPVTKLEIRVVDEQGRGVPEIRVRVLDARTLEPSFRISGAAPDVMSTDADGIVRWEGLQPGGNWRWSAQSPTLKFDPEPTPNVRGWSGPFTLRPNETTRLTGRVVPMLSIVGRIVDGDSRPLSRILVQTMGHDAGPRRFIRSGSTDVDGRFVLDRMPVVPLELLGMGADAPDSITFVRLDVDPVAPVRLDVGVLRPSGRQLLVRLRAVDSAGVDVTAHAIVGASTKIPIEVEGCSAVVQRLSVALGGTFRLVGFDCDELGIRIHEEPPLSSCGPGWAILWDGATTDVATREGEFLLDVPVIRAELVEFTAPAIHRDGVPDQRGVAVLRVSLVPEQGDARLDFDMRALLGMPFGNSRVVPHGRYRLQAACEDDGTRWTATRELVVAEKPGDPVRIDLVRVH